MSVKKDKYFFPKDDFFGFYYFLSYINRKNLSNKNKNLPPKKEIKLRNRSTNNKKISNEYFSLNHILLCKFICRKVCRLENHLLRKLPTPIEGLNCDQIDEYLFASQRLTNKVIKEFNLVNKFKELNVGLIVNCEMKGEHPLCGDSYYDGLDISGFSYSTSLFEKNGIEVLLCGWTDLTIPDSFNHLIKIIKKMYYYINTLNKKIIVHCHAGFGRTAIVLACYYIFTKKIEAEKARQLIRKGGRKRCLGAPPQFNYCKEFGEYLEILRENFYEKNKKDINIFKISENLLNIGEYKFKYFNEDKYIKYVPVFLLYIFDSIIEIKNENKYDENKIFNSLLNYNNVTKGEEIKIENMIKEINIYNFDEIKKCNDLKILGYLLFKWLNKSIKYIFSPTIFKDDNYLSNFKNLNDSSKTIIDCISRFLGLIKEKDNNENIEKLKEFLTIFSPSLFGYLPEDIKKEKESQIAIENLNNFILNNMKSNLELNKKDK